MLTRPKAGIPNWTVEVNAETGAEGAAPVRVFARSLGTTKLTGAGFSAMCAALNTYYTGGKAAAIFAYYRDARALCSVARDEVIADVLATDKDTVVASIQTVLVAAANVQAA